MKKNLKHIIRNISDQLAGRSNLIVIFLLFGFITLSCEEKINLELNTDKNSRLVVQGRITNRQEIQYVYLTRSGSYFSNDSTQAEEGAEVSISGSINSVKLYEDWNNPGLYKTAFPVYGIIGHTYTLNITTKDDKHYAATSYLDTVAGIDSITAEYEFIKYLNHGYYKLRLYTQDPRGKGNIYMFNVYVNDTLDDSNLSNTSFQTDEYFDGQYLHGVEFYYINEDRIIPGANGIQVDMLSISREEYDFNTAFLDETSYSGGLFSGPPANVPSNLKCIDKDGIDGLGFFGASAVNSYRLTIFKK